MHLFLSVIILITNKIKSIFSGSPLWHLIFLIVWSSIISPTISPVNPLFHFGWAFSPMSKCAFVISTNAYSHCGPCFLYPRNNSEYRTLGRKQSVFIPFSSYKPFCWGVRKLLLQSHVLEEKPLRKLSQPRR